jgi:phosphoribosyl-ATP pyrophosphohydrolase
MDEIINEIRVLVEYENKSLPEKIVKFNEEFGEFSAEVIKLLGLTHKPYDRDHLVEESADALQVLFSIFVDIETKTDITIDEIIAKIPEKNQKWLSKIPNYKANDTEGSK